MHTSSILPYFSYTTCASQCAGGFLRYCPKSGICALKSNRHGLRKVPSVRRYRERETILAEVLRTSNFRSSYCPRPRQLPMGIYNLAPITSEAKGDLCSIMTFPFGPSCPAIERSSVLSTTPRPRSLAPAVFATICEWPTLPWATSTKLLDLQLVFRQRHQTLPRHHV